MNLRIPAILFLAACVAAAFAQTQPNVENGFKPYGSYEGSSIDSVNLQNGNLILHIPMPFTYPQRGGRLAPKSVLTVNAKSWAVDNMVTSTGNSAQFWSPGLGRNGSIQEIGTGVGLHSTLDLAVHRFLISTTDTTGTTMGAWGQYLTTWDGGVHQLHAATNTAKDPTGTPVSFDAVDNSGYHVELTNPDGYGITQAGVVTDRAGNRYSFDKFDTQCGRAMNENDANFVANPSGMRSLFLYEMQLFFLQLGQTWSDKNPPPTPSIFISPLIDGTPAAGTPGFTTNCIQASVTSTITDVNGNSVNTENNAAPGDMLGRYPLGLSGPTATADFSGCLSSVPVASATLYTYPSVAGTPVQVKVCAADFLLQTNFGVPGVAEYQNETLDENNGKKTARLIVSVIVLDGPDWKSSSAWSVNYDSYLNVTDLGLPLGGSVHYDWTTVQQPRCSGATPVSRAVAARTVNDGQGNSSVTNYSWGTASNGALANTVTDALGNDTVHAFTALDGTNGCRFYETSTQQYQGAGSGRTLLQQVDTAYIPGSVFGDSSGANGGLGNLLPGSITNTLKPSNRVRRVSRTYDQGPGQTRPIFGNVITESETDWGAGQPGALLRKTETVYQWQQADASGNQPYLAANLLDLPARTVIKDGAGCMAAESVFGYDETAVIASTLGPAQHLNAAPNAVRGNQTSASKWAAPLSGSCAQAPLLTDPVTRPSPAVTARSQWLDTGVVAQATDPLGNTTTYTYDSKNYQGAYLTQTCDALSHCFSGVYDLTTGVLTSFTDQNGKTMASGSAPGDPAHTWSYTYDPVRGLLTDVTAPDGSHTKFKYSAPNTFPVTVEKLKDIDSSRQDDSVSYLDGLARAYKTVHVSANNATVVTAYDGLSHVSSVTNPYFSTSDPTYGLIQTQYDALGRAVRTTAQDGSFSTVDYSLGNCVLSTDESGRQRQACSDGLGRLVEVDEPNPLAAASHAAGSITISGSEQLSQSGRPGSGTVTISGRERAVPTCPTTRCFTVWDTGTVSLTVNGFTKTVGYAKPDTSATVAANLAAAFQGDGNSPVSISVSGSVLTLTAKTFGTGTNYALSASSGSNDTSDFGGPSFTVASNAALTGGQDVSTTPDAGTVSVTINSTTYTVSYGAGDNPSLIAARLAGIIGGDKLASATASGGTVFLASKDAGAATNYTLSAAYAQSSPYTQPSFTTATSGNTLAGGYDAGDIRDNPLVTLYSYDALGNLLCVEQHGGVTGTGCSASPSSDSSSPWRVRRFTYDSLSHLLTASNPESGSISYLYDANGNLLQKVMPAPNQTGTATHTISYCYDALNRITGKAWSRQNCQNGQLPQGTAVVSYSYDSGANGIGRLTSLADQAGSGSYSYDVMGRVASESRTIAGVTKTLGYTYNLNSSVATITYPSGAVITYTPDGAGRMLSAVDSANNINYVTGATYGPDNALRGFVSGQSSSFAGITNTFVYNNRLQPCRMAASSTGAVPTNCTNSWGNRLDLSYDFHLGNGDNGNVYSVINYRDQSRNQTFTYDLLNRLTSAQNAGTACNNKLLDGHTKYWGNSYVYDAWGNLNQKQLTKCWAENLSVAVGAKNQLQGGYAYDAAGNMTYDATAKLDYTYDPENRITGTAPFTYIYDVDGNRVEKSNGSTTPPTGTLYWYMTPGIVGESNLLGTMQSEYIFFDGERVARKDFPSGSVAYYFSDHLKTASVITDAVGNIKSESDYYPWGGELQVANGDSNHYKFTGKERDSETGLDYFGARYYSNGMGRFLTPDWAAKPVTVPYAVLGDPQTLNLYGYVRNLPTTRIDPDGHENLKPGDWGEKYDSTPTEFDHQMSGLLLNGFAMVTGPLGRAFVAAEAIHDLHSGNKAAGVLGLAAVLPMGKVVGSVWKLGNFARGVAIETALGKNLASGFPIIDKFLNGTATSIKSMDLTAKTYQDAGKLASTLDKYIDKVANFNGAQYGNDFVKGSAIKARELQVAIPNGSMSAAQQEVFNAAAARGAALKQPVKLTVTQIQ